MKVWPPVGKKKFETLSYLPDLTEVELGKEVDYLLRNKWIPCVEFELEEEVVMASSMLSSAAVVTSPAQATMVAPFTGLKSSSAFPVTRKANNDITSIVSNGG